MNAPITLDENSAKKIQWYLRNSDGEVLGPQAFDSIVDGILNRKFEFYTMVMNEKNQSWNPLSHYQCFEKYLSAARSKNSEGFDRILENTQVSIDIAKLNKENHKRTLLFSILILVVVFVSMYFLFQYFFH